MVDGYTTMNCLAKFCLNVLRSSLFLEPVFVGHMLPSNTYASSQVNIMSHAKIGIIFNSVSCKLHSFDDTSRINVFSSSDKSSHLFKSQNFRVVL